MKRTVLLLAAFLMPFVASAGAAPSTNPEKVDYQELRDDLQVTSLLGLNVQSDGRDIGAIEDVIFGKDGRIASVIIQREGDIESAAGEAAQAVEDTRASAERAWDDATGERDRPTREAAADASDRGDEGGEAANADQQDGMGLDPDRIGTTELGDAFVKVDWSSLSVDQQAEVAHLAGGGASMQTIQYDQTEALPNAGEVRASNLVGMEVNLSNEESFGEVEDVLIDTKSGKASAIVVDSMQFFDKERFALPVELDTVNAEEEELTVQYTKEQIEGMEEFQMEGDAVGASEDAASGADEEM
ncbi:MAG TPA: PRC-barrel domain-containing protein [Gammaproteobacteria bacterium]